MIVKQTCQILCAVEIVQEALSLRVVLFLEQTTPFPTAAQTERRQKENYTEASTEETFWHLHRSE